MLWKNKKTGVVWDVGDPTTLKRMRGQPEDYEEVKEEKKKKAPE